MRSERTPWLFGKHRILEIRSEIDRYRSKLSAIFLNMELLKPQQLAFFQNEFKLPVYDRCTIYLNSASHQYDWMARFFQVHYCASNFSLACTNERSSAASRFGGNSVLSVTIGSYFISLYVEVCNKVYFFSMAGLGFEEFQAANSRLKSILKMCFRARATPSWRRESI